MEKVFKFKSRLNVLVGKRWKSLISYIGLIFMSSFFEGISLGILYPLMEIILDDTKKQVYLDKVLHYCPFNLDLNSFTVVFLLGILVVFLVKNILVILGAYGQYFLSQMMRVDWQTKIFNTYLKKKYAYFVTAKTGDLIQKQMVHTMTSEGAIMFMCSLARDVLSAFGIIIVLFIISPKVTLVTLVVLFLCLGVFILISKRNIYKDALVYADLQQEAYSLVAEAINGMKEIKLFHAQKYFKNLFQCSVRAQAKIYIKNATLGMCPPPIMQIFASIILVGVMLFFAKAGVSYKAVLPLMVVFGGGLHRLIRLASTINSCVMQISQTLPSVEIVSNLLSSLKNDEGVDSTDVVEKKGYKENIRFNNILELKNIEFSHDGTDQKQLNGIDLTIEKGKFYGIVGASGCGKTTLVDLMIGLHTLKHGEVLLDGKSFKLIGELEWLGLFGFVSQSPFIFSGTVEENIAFAVDSKNIDHARVKISAQLSGLANVIKRLDDGYKTFVGEKGFKLSGGERQRLSIARAIYRDPQIYIFDEATSSLDSESEKEIQRSIEVLSSEKKTIIAIAHRLSTIKNADELIVMERGRIVEQGNHSALLKMNGVYANLYKTQYEK